MGNSTTSLQSVADWAKLFPDIKPVIYESGWAVGPILLTANDVMQYILGEKFPWKFSQIQVPEFYTNSWQQDYAIPGVTNLAWLQDGNILDVNNTSNPKPRLQVEVDRYLPPSSASIMFNSIAAQPKFYVNWLNNNQLYYGTWGASNSMGSTSGNNPQINSVYTNPVGAGNQPSNPITQIKDANGNYLVLTTYGHEGSAAPAAAANSAPGTTVSGSGATTVWTVVDPYGQGFRILPIPSQSGKVWQFNLIGQQKPPLFTSLSQMLDPLPDDYATLFRQGFVTFCYQRSPLAKVQAKFDKEFELWRAALQLAKVKSDRERDAAGFVAESIIAPLGIGWVGPAFPFGNPIT